MQMRGYEDSDWVEWQRLSADMYPHHSPKNLAKWTRAFLARTDSEVFIAERPDGGLAGYVEVASRLYADGCETSPVGYIEAWYVDPDARRAGIGRSLLDAAERWSRSRGYKEIASDAQLENITSHQAHEKAGHFEVERSVKFRKLLK